MDSAQAVAGADGCTGSSQGNHPSLAVCIALLHASEKKKHVGNITKEARAEQKRVGGKWNLLVSFKRDRQKNVIPVYTCAHWERETAAKDFADVFSQCVVRGINFDALYEQALSCQHTSQSEPAVVEKIVAQPQVHHQVRNASKRLLSEAGFDVRKVNKAYIAEVTQQVMEENTDGTIVSLPHAIRDRAVKDLTRQALQKDRFYEKAEQDMLRYYNNMAPQREAWLQSNQKMFTVAAERYKKREFHMLILNGEAPLDEEDAGWVQKRIPHIFTFLKLQIEHATTERTMVKYMLEAGMARVPPETLQTLRSDIEKFSKTGTALLIAAKAISETKDSILLPGQMLSQATLLEWVRDFRKNGGRVSSDHRGTSDRLDDGRCPAVIPEYVKPPTLDE